MSSSVYQISHFKLQLLFLPKKKKIHEGVVQTLGKPFLLTIFILFIGLFPIPVVAEVPKEQVQYSWEKFGPFFNALPATGWD